MDTTIFNEINIEQLLPWFVAVLLFCALIKIYMIFFAKKKVNLQHTVYFACDSCGWEGHISKFGTRCPKCDTAAEPLRTES